MNSWLETITDTQLRELVKENLLVSGGSITSLYRNEEVNDYDVYLQKESVARRLAEYYLHNMPDTEVFTYSKMLGVPPEQVSGTNKLGTFLRNIGEEQVKVWTGHESGIKISTIPATDKDYKPYQLAYVSPNALSLTDNLQIVLRFTGDEKQIHSTFDFIHATNYFTFERGLVTNKEAVTSILEKDLKYQGSRYPLTSVIRSKKFVTRGWTIGAGEYLKMMYQISKLDLDNFDVLEEQLIGIDVAYFDQLIRALRDHKDNHPSFVLTAEYFNTLIDKIFKEQL